MEIRARLCILKGRSTRWQGARTRSAESLLPGCPKEEMSCKFCYPTPSVILVFRHFSLRRKRGFEEVLAAGLGFAIAL